MKIHRFIGEYNFNKKKIVLRDQKVVRQIKHVLRLKKGYKIALIDKKDQEALCSISAFGKGAILVEVLDVMNTQDEVHNRVCLYCAILKRSNFELVVQKATEVGVDTIVPLLTKHTIKLNLKKERLEKIIQEACEQSGKVHILSLHDILTFTEALEHSKKNDTNLLFHHPGEKLEFSKSASSKIGIFIRPEGGWERSEIDDAKRNKFKLVTLGSMTLRSETEAIISSYLLAQ